jgi:hypothetical protein
MRDLIKSWGLGDSGDTPIYKEVGLKMITTTLDDYNKDNQIVPSHSLTLLPPTTIQAYFDGLCQPCNWGNSMLCFHNQEGRKYHL